MPETPEDRARKTIDELLAPAGWLVQDRDQANISAGRGVAVRNFPLKSGYGFADYLLYVDGRRNACGLKSEHWQIRVSPVPCFSKSLGTVNGAKTLSRCGDI
jgi:hypothetical protein